MYYPFLMHIIINIPNFITSITQIESLPALPLPLKKYLDFVHVATDSLISHLQEKFEGPEVTALIKE